MQNVGKRLVNTAAAAGVAAFSFLVVGGPFQAKLLAKEPLPLQQTQEKLKWTVALSGSFMNYVSKMGEKTVDSGTMLLDGKFVEGVTGKPPSEVQEKDLLAGGNANDVFVLVGAKGLGAIWMSSSPNTDDRVVLFTLPFEAKRASISENGIITVEGANGEKKTYKVLLGPKKQPQLLEVNLDGAG